MERLFIVLAILVCAAALVAVVAMSTRARREPLRMDSEFDAEDADLLIGPVGAPASPIDRSAQILDAETGDVCAIEPPEPGRTPAPRLPDAAR